MSQLPINKEYNTFVKGLVTEAGPFTFPENASIDEENFILNRKGYRERRPGIDFESQYTLISTIDRELFKNFATSTYKWNDVNTGSDLVIIIVQIGYFLYFFDGTKTPVSGNILNGGNPLDLSKVELPGGVDEYITVDAKVICSYADISGKCVVVNGSKGAFILKYNADDDKVIAEIYGILVRDIWGVAEPLAVNYRPEDSELEDTHSYNMWNQGWGAISATSGVPYGNSFFSQEGVWPSNADTPVSGIDTTSSNSFDADLVINSQQGSTPAPKGAHIIDLFDRGASRLAAYEKLSVLNNYDVTEGGWDYELPANASKFLRWQAEVLFNRIDTDLTLTLPTDKSKSGVTCVSSYAGRIFYSGFNSEVINGDSRSPNLGTYIAYTQVLDNDEKTGKCYQEADPTSWLSPDLVATDGGTIKIPEASSIVKLVPFHNGLLVFAKNGVWEIRGQDSTFSATDNKVIKVSDTGSVNAGSILVTENSVVYWAISGIYELTVDSFSSNIVSNSLTVNTIQSFYDDISFVSKTTATGTYSSSSKKMSWVLSTEESFTNYSDRFKFNLELVYDRVLGSFYKLVYKDVGPGAPLTPYISGIFNPARFISEIYEESVFTVTGAKVTTTSLETVAVEETLPSSAPLDVSYLCVFEPVGVGNAIFTFAGLNNSLFKDWYTYSDQDALDANAYLETGYQILEDTQRQKQLNYITVHMERTENGFDVDLNPLNQSSCYLQTKWDFVDLDTNIKWRPSQQVYRLRTIFTPSGAGSTFDYGKSVISTKNKIRGRGRALTLRFSTEEEKNCILYGWGVEYAGNSSV